MEKVHVFISTGRFRSLDEVQAFVDKTYTEDGDGIPSPFMREVGLSEYEPGCIEAVHEAHATPLSMLLAGASYADQWLRQLDGDRAADAAVCVFAPNRVRHPQRSSLEYVGSYDYEVAQAWPSPRGGGEPDLRAWGRWVPHMGHDYISYRGRGVRLLDSDVWELRHLLSREASEVDPAEFGVDAATLRLLRDHLRAGHALISSDCAQQEPRRRAASSGCPGVPSPG